MEINTFNPKDMIFSLDIGTRSIIGTVGVVREKKFEVICEKYKEHEERAMIDGQIHDINLVAKVVADIKKDLEAEIGLQLKEVSIAAAGRFLRTSEARSDIELNGDQEVDKEILRTLELSAVKKAESEINKSTDGKLYCVGYSVKGYYLNSYIISNLLGHKGEKIGADVIATFLPRSVIDSLYSVMNKVNLKVINLTLEPIAAIEAAVPQNLRLLNIALVDIGAGTSDIAISSKETISSYGMVPMAGDEVTELIAQEYLVDFNSAESIKRQVSTCEEITYTDVLGLENTISSENIKKLIKPIVSKIAEAISNKIIEINGGKSPSAVFLVGGGAHTPGILEEIADRLNIPAQRIAIKDRKSVPECISDNGLGSAGVTVLGIALSAIKKLGNDFIDVKLNDEPISLFNSHKHTVMDVLLQAGINPALLMGKNGKSIRFTINGNKRLVFGELGKNARISINKKKSDIETEVKAGDEIKVTYAQNGKDASPKLSEIIKDVNSISIFVDDEIVNLEPICIINGKEKKITTNIKNGDDIEVFIPNDILRFKKYIMEEKVVLFKDNIKLSDDYILLEGDKLYTKYIEEIKVEETKEESGITINVVVNKEKVQLHGKSSYMFVDIFNYIDFDLTSAKGNIRTLLNGKEVAYTDKLNEGDQIEVFWN
ncbi:cell division protein FtsA [Clostridium paraputrificum]|uniref:cell division protein FtsA n=1 Tax=Clostridium paraputrificum TaxID=29363 RepID=UPI003D358F9C